MRWWSLGCESPAAVGVEGMEARRALPSSERVGCVWSAKGAAREPARLLKVDVLLRAGGFRGSGTGVRV